MKINDLIIKLQEIATEHGNVEVMCWPYDGQQDTYSLSVIELQTEGGEMFVVLDT